MPERARVEKTPSLKDTLSKIDSLGSRQNTEDQNKAELKDRPDNRLRNSFTQEQLTERWQLFVERLKKNDTRMYVALKSVQPLVQENDKVVIYFQNNAQLEEYQMRLKPTLLAELKENLKNEFIELTEQVTEAEKLERPKLLSDKERLEQMIEKNPALQLLRKKFNLDFD